MYSQNQTPNRPDASVVIAVYKDVDLLKITLESVLTQTLRNIEVVLIDDGNREFDRKKLRLLAGSDQRITLLENHFNKGLTSSLISGIKVARAPYIARIDNGDLMVPRDRLEKQLAKLHRNPALVVVGGKMEVLDLMNNDIYRSKDKKWTNTILKEYASSGRSAFCHVTVMFSRAAYNEVGGYNPSCITGQDTELWPRLLSAGRGEVINEVFAVAPMRPESISVSQNNKQIFVAMRRQYNLAITEKTIFSIVKGAGRICAHCLKLLLPIKYRIFLRYRLNYLYVGKLEVDCLNDYECIWERYRNL